MKDDPEAVMKVQAEMDKCGSARPRSDPETTQRPHAAPSMLQLYARADQFGQFGRQDENNYSDF